MALRIRLARAGAKKRPFYRIVVAEATAPRDGRFVEKLGTYNPMLPKDHALRVVLNSDNIKLWLGRGAQPTDRVSKFLSDAGLIPAVTRSETPQKSQPKKKAQERLKEKEAAAEAARAASAESAATEA